MNRAQRLQKLLGDLERARRAGRGVEANRLLNRFNTLVGRYQDDYTQWVDQRPDMVAYWEREEKRTDIEVSTEGNPIHLERLARLRPCDLPDSRGRFLPKEIGEHILASYRAGNVQPIGFFLKLVPLQARAGR